MSDVLKSVLADKAEELIETWICEYTSWDDGEFSEEEIEEALEYLSKVKFKVTVEEIVNDK